MRTAPLLALVGFSGLALAHSHACPEPRGACPAGTVGAAYLITNAINGTNMIVAIPINAAGKLQSQINIVPSGGMGGVGTIANVTPGTAHADSLFSQDSVRVQGNNLFIVNAGSNTMSMFKINSCPTSLTPISTVSSGGDFPTSVAINAEGTMACVLNSGAANGVACTGISSAGLLPMGALLSTGLSQTTPPKGPGGTVSDVIFDNQQNLLVSVKGTSASEPGYLGVVNIVKGQPTSITKNVPNGGAITFSITALPSTFGSGNDIFTTDPAVGAVTFQLGCNATSVATPITGNKATCWGDFSPVTKSVFTSDVATSQIREVSINPSTLAGTIVAQTQLGVAAGNIDLRVAKMKAGGNMLFVTNAGNQSITVMQLQAGGKSKVVQNFNVAAAVSTIKGATALTKSMQGMDVKIL